MRTYLHLQSGEVFEGEAFGYCKEADGEVVFSTGMVGYVESLTDPSYTNQILTFTYPLIGNYGVSKLSWYVPGVCMNRESERIHAAGVVVSEHCIAPSHRESVMTFHQWLHEEKIPGIAGVDTRVLTQVLREQGTVRGIISPKRQVQFDTASSEMELSVISCSRIVSYNGKTKNGKHVVLLDCGVKHGILRTLLGMGYRITRIPWNADPYAIPNIDGFVVSNGPGDPKSWKESVAVVRNAIAREIPTLGICLGHQLIALASGGETYKLPYGHRGINQPCRDLVTGKTYITSQNHGYAIDASSLPAGFEEWFVNLNDGTNEGIRHKVKPIQSVQFHPEGFPGPCDAEHIFRFI